MHKQKLKSDYRKHTVDTVMSKDLSNKRRFFSFSLGQMFFIWVNFALITIIVFAVGFYVGRSVGVDFALANQNDVNVRVPLIRPIMPGGKEDEIKKIINEVPAYLSGLNVERDENTKLARQSDDGDTNNNTVVSTVNSSSRISSLRANTKSSTRAVVVSSVSSSTQTISNARSVVNSSSAQSVASTKQPVVSDDKWYVQVVATPTEQDAQAIVKATPTIAEQNKILPVTKNGKITAYKIIVGPFKTKAEAEDRKTKLMGTRRLAKDMFVSKFY